MEERRNVLDESRWTPKISSTEKTTRFPLQALRNTPRISHEENLKESFLGSDTTNTISDKRLETKIASATPINTQQGGRNE